MSNLNVTACKARGITNVKRSDGPFEETETMTRLVIFDDNLCSTIQFSRNGL